MFQVLLHKNKPIHYKSGGYTLYILIDYEIEYYEIPNLCNEK